MPVVIRFVDALACALETPGEEISILEASLHAGVAHYHQCNGNARCTTCRVRVLEGRENLSPPDELEAGVLRSHAMGEDIRLACRARVRGDVVLERIILDPSALTGSEFEPDSKAEERPLAVMFCDLRNFTRFAHMHLPQDVIYVLNRYFREICEPVFANRGLVNQYLGDGFLALFGLQGNDTRECCMDATRAAMRILERLERFNLWLEASFSSRFSCGIGLDFGLCVVGRAGHPLQKQLMVIGDPVNRASRIEAQTKMVGAAVLASERFHDEVADRVESRPIGHAALKGYEGEAQLFEVSGIAREDAHLIIQREFDQVRHDASRFTTVFYRRLFAADPSIAPLFEKTDMALMGEKLLRTLALCIDNLSRMESIKEELDRLGELHRSRGVSQDHIQLGGQVLIASLTEFLGTMSPTSREAWAGAYASITAGMLGR